MARPLAAKVTTRGWGGAGRLRGVGRGRQGRLGAVERRARDDAVAGGRSGRVRGGTGGSGRGSPGDAGDHGTAGGALLRLTDVALTMGLAALLLPSSLNSGEMSGQRAGDIAIVAVLVVAHLTVLLRRRPAGLLLCAAAMAALLVPELRPPAPWDSGTFPAILLPSSLVFPLVLYSAAAHTRRPWPGIGLGLGLAGAGLTALRLWTSADWPAAALGDLDPGELLTRLAILGALIALVLASWALGRYRAVRAAYLAQLEGRAARAEADRERHAARVAAEERTRVAREMHDVVAHALAVIVRQAEGGRIAGERDPAVALETLETVAGTGREALDDTRSVLGRLRGDGAEDAPQRGAEDVAGLVERLAETGLGVRLRTTGSAAGLSRTASLAVYRVVQESLTNVVKHAGEGARAEVRISYGDDGAEVTVTDAGGTVRPVRGGPGHGLIGMRERVALEGGDLTAQPTAEGFIVRASIPARPGPATREAEA